MFKVVIQKWGRVIMQAFTMTLNIPMLTNVGNDVMMAEHDTFWAARSAR